MWKNLQFELLFDSNEMECALIALMFNYDVLHEFLLFTWAFHTPKLNTNQVRYCNCFISWIFNAFTHISAQRREIMTQGPWSWGTTGVASCGMPCPRFCPTRCASANVARPWPTWRSTPMAGYRKSSLRPRR